MKYTPLKELNCDTIDTKSMNFDFGEGYPVTWESYEAAECEECGNIQLVTGEDECEECGEYLYADGPMMNYFYPLPSASYDNWEADDAKKLINLPLCLVYFTNAGQWALALTGGGMDLSWEICEAFMILGFKPPVNFCDLPNMAGMELTERNKWILEGCKQSCDISATWAETKRDRLEQMMQNMETE